MGAPPAPYIEKLILKRNALLSRKLRCANDLPKNNQNCAKMTLTVLLLGHVIIEVKVNFSPGIDHLTQNYNYKFFVENTSVGSTLAGLALSCIK